MDFLFPIPPLGGPFQRTPCPHRRDPIGGSYALVGLASSQSSWRQRQRQTSMLAKRTDWKMPSLSKLGGREGFRVTAKKKNKARGGRLQVQPRLRCMAGAPLAGSVRSKSSGSPKPTTLDQSHRVPVSHFPISRFEERARCLQFAQLATVPACIGSRPVCGRAWWPQDRQSPERERGIEHCFDAVTGGRPRLLNVKSISIADQWQHLRVCHDDATQSKGPSDRRCPIVVDCVDDAVDAGCHFLPTILCIFDVRHS